MLREIDIFIHTYTTTIVLMYPYIALCLPAFGAYGCCYWVW